MGFRIEVTIYFHRAGETLITHPPVHTYQRLVPGQVDDCEQPAVLTRLIAESFEAHPTFFDEGSELSAGLVTGELLCTVQFRCIDPKESNVLIL